jgi:hypothetical protein
VVFFQTARFLVRIYRLLCQLASSSTHDPRAHDNEPRAHDPRAHDNEPRAHDNESHVDNPCAHNPFADDLDADDYDPRSCPLSRFSRPGCQLFGITTRLCLFCSRRSSLVMCHVGTTRIRCVHEVWLYMSSGVL